MKQQASPFVIAGAAILALALLAFLFVRNTSEPAPTATNLPDYSKMSPEDIAKEKAGSLEAERANQAPR